MSLTLNRTSYNVEYKWLTFNIFNSTTRDVLVWHSIRNKTVEEPKCPRSRTRGIDMFLIWKKDRHRDHKGSPWWRHQMETFSVLLAIYAGNSPVGGEFPARRPVTRSLMFSLIYVWINGWVNSREAGDLGRYHAHYDVIVMSLPFC